MGHTIWGHYFPGGDPSKIVCPRIENFFCFKLDAMSVPEALATTIRILLMFSIVLAHRQLHSGRRPSAHSKAAPVGINGHPGCPSAPLGALAPTFLLFT